MPAAIDIKPGTRFSHLRVLSRNLEVGPGRGRHWNCVCDCGGKVVWRANSLTAAGNHSCGCMRGRRDGVFDLTGMQFGRLVAVRLDYDKGRQGAHWICKCSCGKETSVRCSSLTSKNTKSCGCNRAKGFNIAWKLRWGKVETPNLLGKTYGWLTIVSGPVRGTGRRKDNYWSCRCKCGKLAMVRQRSLVSNHTKSCGCGRGVCKKRVFRADKIPYAKAMKFRGHASPAR